MAEEFNDLELAILGWFRTHYNNERLSAQIDSARPITRRWTNVGFYVDIEVSKKLPVIDLSDFKGNWPINGPTLSSPDIQHGGGSILWGKDGYINCIEIYAFGDYFKSQVGKFTLP